MGQPLQFLQLSLSFILVSACLALGPYLPAQAQVFAGSTAAALGGAGRAGAEGTESLFFNPAVLAHMSRVEVGVFGLSGDWAAGESHKSLAFSVLDANPELPLPGALSYLKRRRDLPSGAELEEELWQVSVGQFVWPHWAVGLSVLRLQQDLSSAVESLPWADAGRKVQWNGALGVLYTPQSHLGVAWTFHNFIPASSRVTEELRLLPKMGLGGKYLMTDFLRLRLDLEKLLEQNPGGKVDVAMGLESLVGEFVALRLGSRWEPSQGREFFTAGLGFMGPRFLLNYSYQNRLRSGDTVHGVDLRLAF